MNTRFATLVADYARKLFAVAEHLKVLVAKYTASDFSDAKHRVVELGRQVELCRVQGFFRYIEERRIDQLFDELVAYLDEREAIAKQDDEQARIILANLFFNAPRTEDRPVRHPKQKKPVTGRFADPNILEKLSGRLAEAQEHAPGRLLHLDKHLRKVAQERGVTVGGLKKHGKTKEARRQ